MKKNKHILLSFDGSNGNIDVTGIDSDGKPIKDCWVTKDIGIEGLDEVKDYLVDIVDSGVEVYGASITVVIKYLGDKIEMLRKNENVVYNTKEGSLELSGVGTCDAFGCWEESFKLMLDIGNAKSLKSVRGVLVNLDGGSGKYNDIIGEIDVLIGNCDVSGKTAELKMDENKMEDDLDYRLKDFAWAVLIKIHEGNTIMVSDGKDENSKTMIYVELSELSISQLDNLKNRIHTLINLSYNLKTIESLKDVYRLIHQVRLIKEMDKITSIIKAPVGLGKTDPFKDFNPREFADVSYAQMADGDTIVLTVPIDGRPDHSYLLNIDLCDADRLKRLNDRILEIVQGLGSGDEWRRYVGISTYLDEKIEIKRAMEVKAWNEANPDIRKQADQKNNQRKEDYYRLNDAYQQASQANKGLGVDNINLRKVVESLHTENDELRKTKTSVMAKMEEYSIENVSLQNQLNKMRDRAESSGARVRELEDLMAKWGPTGIEDLKTDDGNMIDFKTTDPKLKKINAIESDWKADLSKEIDRLNAWIRKLCISQSVDEHGRDVIKLNDIIGEMEKSIADQDNELEALEADMINMEKENEVLWSYYEWNEQAMNTGSPDNEKYYQLDGRIKEFIFERIHNLENRLKNE